MIGPTAGMVINRSTRSISNESCSSERTSALSVLPSRTTVSRHSRKEHKLRMLPLISFETGRRSQTQSSVQDHSLV
ncbi:MAG: hypothetical protein JWO71_3407 [Candidatus Acidoferrum typicum]|nr:hypothetical protein [Candidatus Acidoferrum typicum]